MGEYLKEIFLRPLYVLWIIITGLATLAAYIGLGSNVSDAHRVLVISIVSLAFLLFLILLSGYGIYRRIQSPVKIRLIIEGSHYYAGKLIIILEKTHWLRQDQMLTLFIDRESIPTPICLIRVETFTTDGFPQCVVILPLTHEELSTFLRDDTRRSSLSAKAEVLGQYLER